MTTVTRDRLIHVVGFALSVAFFVTWEPLFGLAAFALVIFFAAWPDEADDAEGRLRPPPDDDPSPASSA
jgi:hypothetical protein